MRTTIGIELLPISIIGHYALDFNVDLDAVLVAKYTDGLETSFTVSYTRGGRSCHDVWRQVGEDWGFRYWMKQLRWANPLALAPVV